MSEQRDYELYHGFESEPDPLDPDTAYDEQRQTEIDYAALRRREHADERLNRVIARSLLNPVEGEHG